MPNYLHRLAISAARTTSAARPPALPPTVVSHTIVPGRPADLNIFDAEALPDLESPSRRTPAAEKASIRPDTNSAQPALLPVSSLSPTTMQKSSALPAVPASGPAAGGLLIHAAKGLRRASQKGAQTLDLPVPIQQSLSTPATSGTSQVGESSAEAAIERTVSAPMGVSEYVPTAVPQTTPPAASPELNALQNEESSEAKPPFVPAAPAPPTASVSDSLIHAPKTLRCAGQSSSKSQSLPAPMKVTLSTFTARPKASATEAALAGKPESPPAHSSGGLSIQNVSEPEAQPQTSRSSRVSDSGKERPRVEVRTTSSRQPVVPAVPSHATNSISIGRVEVQVNNTPAAPDPSPPPAPSAHLNFLETRYLNRFSLKP